MKILKNLTERFENAMIAVTFAEAGELETARKIMLEKSRQKKILVRKQRETIRQISQQIR